MLLSKINLFASLAFAATVAATGDVQLHTDDLGLLNKMGVADFLAGWDEAGLIVNAITFHQAANETDQVGVPTTATLASRSLRFTPRGPAAPLATCGKPSCYVDQKYNLFSPAQERFITGKICPVVANYAPTLGAVTIGVVASAAICESRTCTLFVSATIGIAGRATGLEDALKAKCQQSYDAIQSGCGDLGGNDTCEIVGATSNYARYAVGAVAPGYTCPANEAKCVPVTCNASNNNCQNY